MSDIEEQKYKDDDIEDFSAFLENKKVEITSKLKLIIEEQKSNDEYNYDLQCFFKEYFKTYEKAAELIKYPRVEDFISTQEISLILPDQNSLNRLINFDTVKIILDEIITVAKKNNYLENNNKINPPNGLVGLASSIIWRERFKKLFIIKDDLMLNNVIKYHADLYKNDKSLFEDVFWPKHGKDTNCLSNIFNQLGSDPIIYYIMLAEQISNGKQECFKVDVDYIVDNVKKFSLSNTINIIAFAKDFSVNDEHMIEISDKVLSFNHNKNNDFSIMMDKIPIGLAIAVHQNSVGLDFFEKAEGRTLIQQFSKSLKNEKILNKFIDVVIHCHNERDLEFAVSIINACLSSSNESLANVLFKGEGSDRILDFISKYDEKEEVEEKVLDMLFSNCSDSAKRLALKNNKNLAKLECARHVSEKMSIEKAINLNETKSSSPVNKKF